MKLPRPAIFGLVFKYNGYGAAVALALAALLSGCATDNWVLADWTKNHPESITAATARGPGKGVRAADYVPAHVVYRNGYRAGIPLYSPSLDFLDCEGLDPEQITDIHYNFADPLIAPNDSEYADFIDDVVVKGADHDPGKTTFTIWLFSGRHLDSGPIFTDKHGKQTAFDHHKMGAVMYARAIQMLKKEIPAWKLKAGNNPRNWPEGPEDVGPVKGTTSDDFLPYYAGYRSGIPAQSASVDYLSCEGLEMANIQEHFAAPLTNPSHGKYSAFIGAVVVKSVCNEWELTTFTIWLRDGRRLDSGPVFVDKNGKQMSFEYSSKGGAVMYARAMKLLKKAIPESEIRTASRAGAGRESY